MSQEAFVENLDHGAFFDLLYEGEDDIVKLDVLEMVSSVRQTYPFLTLFLAKNWHGCRGPIIHYNFGFNTLVGWVSDLRGGGRVIDFAGHRCKQQCCRNRGYIEG